MSGYKVLNASDNEEWYSYLNKMEKADIYFTPEYCKIYENNKEGTAQLFVYSEGEHYICYPYLLRRINDLPLPNVQKINKDLYDIITPYGYGGPITNVKDEADKKRIFDHFGNVFSDYCKGKGIVTEFVRFHPVIKNHADYEAVIPTNNRNTVCIDLTNSEEDLMNNLSNKCRNRVKYAMKHGLTVCQEDPENLEYFIEQYYATMDKNNADTYYYFPKDYFMDTIQLLKDHISLFVVKYQDKVIASTFFLHYNDYVSYHLTGSVKEYLLYAPYNLLISYSSSWFKAKGYKYLHLGGGYTGNDDLLRFKKTFTKQPPLDFYIGRKVHIPEMYQLLTKNLTVSDDYFPLYRQPSLYLSPLDSAAN